MNTPKKEIYLFDYDGTLVDSMPVYGGVILRILNEHHVDYPPNILKITTPLGLIKTAEYFIELGIQKSHDEVMRLMLDYMIDGYTNDVPAKPTVVETLHALKARGASLNVLTASPHDTLDPCLKRIGIFDIFDNVWSCNDFGTTKTDPEIYKMAADRLGVAVGDVIFIDDNYNADKTAKEAGMVVYGIFDETSREYIDDIKEITDRYIFDFKELL